jgi:hypothetical protein
MTTVKELEVKLKRKLENILSTNLNHIAARAETRKNGQDLRSRKSRKAKKTKNRRVDGI